MIAFKYGNDTYWFFVSSLSKAVRWLATHFHALFVCSIQNDLKKIAANFVTTLYEFMCPWKYQKILKRFTPDSHLVSQWGKYLTWTSKTINCVACLEVMWRWKRKLDFWVLMVLMSQHFGVFEIVLGFEPEKFVFSAVKLSKRKNLESIHKRTDHWNVIAKLFPLSISRTFHLESARSFCKIACSTLFIFN